MTVLPVLLCVECNYYNSVIALEQHHHNGEDKGVKLNCRASQSIIPHYFSFTHDFQAINDPHHFLKTKLKTNLLSQTLSTCCHMLCEI